MAKELPYFKFEPSEWDNGNIQICSFEERGVFIGLCSMYWIRLGDLPYKLAVQKLCGGNATVIDSLYDNEIIDIIDGLICIDFLNEQLDEFENKSQQNRENARLGWEKRRETTKKKANTMRPHSERNAIREDKIIEKEKKEDNIRVNKTIEERKAEFKNSLHPFLESYSKDLLNDFYSYWTEHGSNDKKMRFEKEKSFGISRRLLNWKKNEEKFRSQNQKSKFEKGQDVFLQLMLNDPECQNDPAVIEYRKNNNLGTLKLEQ